jgi:hypothetical protein
MAGRFFTAAALFAAAFASTVSDPDNSTASTFSYSSSTEEIANTPATDEYGMSPSSDPRQNGDDQQWAPKCHRVYLKSEPH